MFSEKSLTVVFPDIQKKGDDARRRKKKSLAYFKLDKDDKSDTDGCRIEKNMFIRVITFQFDGDKRSGGKCSLSFPLLIYIYQNLFSIVLRIYNKTFSRCRLTCI